MAVTLNNYCLVALCPDPCFTLAACGLIRKKGEASVDPLQLHHFSEMSGASSVRI